MDGYSPRHAPGRFALRGLDLARRAIGSALARPAAGQDRARDHIGRMIQPFDAPAELDLVERMIDHLGSDAILLYADFPHWQFDDDEARPPGLPGLLRREILADNPLATCARMQEDARCTSRPGNWCARRDRASASTMSIAHKNDNP
jgi:hypothetical protein